MGLIHFGDLYNDGVGLSRIIDYKKIRPQNILLLEETVISRSNNKGRFKYRLMVTNIQKILDFERPEIRKNPHYKYRTIVPVKNHIISISDLSFEKYFNLYNKIESKEDFSEVKTLLNHYSPKIQSPTLFFRTQH